LIRPSMDPYGYTWTVPHSTPQALTAWQPDVTSTDDLAAFPAASSISQLRVGPDGARIAAVVVIGGQRWIVAASIVRDESQAPVEIGPLHMIAQLDGEATGLSWIGSDTLSVLVDDEGNRVVLTQGIGGPGSRAAAPEGARTLS